MQEYQKCSKNKNGHTEGEEKETNDRRAPEKEEEEEKTSNECFLTIWKLFKYEKQNENLSIPK